MGGFASGMVSLVTVLTTQVEGTIGSVETVERGYASLLERLGLLGAQVQRE